MASNALFCADKPLKSYSLIYSFPSLFFLTSCPTFVFFYSLPLQFFLILFTFCPKFSYGVRRRCELPSGFRRSQTAERLLVHL